MSYLIIAYLSCQIPWAFQNSSTAQSIRAHALSAISQPQNLMKFKGDENTQSAADPMKAQMSTPRHLWPS
jgi:hypothetical protein